MSIFDIEAAAQFLGNLLVQEVQYLGGVRDNLDELRSEFEWMQCFLEDADKKQNKDAVLRKWMFDIRDIAIEAEDIIETSILKAFHAKEGEYGFYLLWPSCVINYAISLHNLGPQIDRLTGRINRLILRLKAYGVTADSYDLLRSHHNKMRDDRRTYWSYYNDDTGDIVGLESRVNDLVSRLQGPQKIVVVHGMGGIGKTTLAKEVLRHPRSKSHFLCFAWTYVSQQFQIEAIYRDILNQLVPDKRMETNNMSVADLAGLLSNILALDNCLVVLDDVWTVEDWNHLSLAIPIKGTSFSSKLLITTRNPQILSHLGDGVVRTFKAEILDDIAGSDLLHLRGNFWTMTRNSYSWEGPYEHSDRSPYNARMLRFEMQMVSKMLEHCNGNPLAIVALGGILATKRTWQEWKSVSDNLQYYLQGDISYSRVYDVLAMGYHDLLYRIKPCFLHMGHFPKGSHINVDRIHNLWIAEGIVSLTREPFGGNRSLEDIADEYLNQLVQKGMIEAFDVGVDGRINSCGLHGLLREKCLLLTREENFLQIINPELQNCYYDAGVGTKKIRRLTMYVGKEAQQSFQMALSKGISSLRSLLFVSVCAEEERKKVTCKSVKDVCKRFKLLRVLDFEGVALEGTLPRKIGMLIYLRYLSLKGTNVTELPSSIKKLRSLLILDLRVKNVRIKIPNVLWKITSLRRLYFPENVLDAALGQGYDALGQGYDALGQGYDALGQGYEIKGNKKKLTLDYLSHLERVDNVDLDRVEETGLPRLSSLQKLSATCKREKAVLQFFLQSINIKHVNLQIDVDLLIEEHNLLHDSTSLRILHINADMDSQTILTVQIDMFPYHLVELRFSYCKIEVDPMPVLEKLVNLKSLHFCLCYIGQSMNCSATSFPALTYLVLDQLFHLIHLNVEEGGFPKLKKVEIYSCPLDSIPIALPSNILISCSPPLQRIVDHFRRVKLEAEPGSSTGPQ